MKTKIYALITMAIVAILLVSCKKDPQPPVVEIFFEADADDPYTIDFTTTSENATSFAWDFGDGNTGPGATVSHTYEMSGDKIVVVTVSGDGGNATDTKTVTITAGLAELLSGGPDAVANGKTWKLSRTATAGVDGMGIINDEFVTDLMPGTDDQLDLLGLGDEYDNLFTFYHDGTYAIDNRNGNHLAGWVYAVQTLATIATQTDIGIFAITSVPSARPTWTLIENTDLEVQAWEEVEGSDPIDKTVLFEGADYITFAAL